jgi:hypothetical protein
MATSVLFSLIVTTTSSIFAEEYDLSDHPVYNWEYNPDANFSNEIYSKPTVSNQYHLEAISSFIDPNFVSTRIYYEKTIMTFDYCDLEQFSKYPKCK